MHLRRINFYRSQQEDNYMSESDNLEKMILSTGIRVGTPVKTKYMTPYIVRANPGRFVHS